MTLLLTTEALQARRAALANPDALGGLAISLQRELHAALDVPIPEGKSRLTRHGGRCATCTVLLAFDPRSPHAHTCPSCGTVSTEHVHHEWWLMNAHLWTAEQCTRAAALAFLLGDARAAARADEILITYTGRYLDWPNRDNALGPTRPFFSTYLESIWLLHLAVALDLREQAGSTHGSAVRERLIAPSAALITSFPEGRSNREVWHVAARLAAAQLLGDGPMRDDAAASLMTVLRTGLHTDGSWYEGENYHLFAHRGLLSAVTLAERAGVALPADLLARFESGFASPFRTMLPDGTFPSRRDSQYGISLRQYRTADWLECGMARHDTPPLRAALAMMYEPSVPGGDTGRAFSTADAERNQRGVRLTRADCSWRTLLLGRLDLPSLQGATPQTELLDGQGLAVFRRDAGRFWVGLDYGDPGAGHGHPDRLNLVIATGTHRWLDDMGTGSYTSPTLAWYRSSLAHNAPMVNGRDQGAARGSLLAFDERGDCGWIVAVFIDPVSLVRFVRTVVVAHDHVIDEITWEGDGREVFVDLPLQAKVRDVTSGDAWLSVTGAAEWSPFLRDEFGVQIAADTVTSMRCEALPSPTLGPPHAPEAFQLHVWTGSRAFIRRATTIGPPAGAAHGMVSLRQFSDGASDGSPGRPHGRSVRLIAPANPGLSLTVDEQAIVVTRHDGTTIRHSATDTGWLVQDSGAAGAGVGLAGRVAPTNAPAPAPPSVSVVRERIVCADAGEGRRQTTLCLGQDAYRPTEVAWIDAGQPAAEITIGTQLPDASEVSICAEVVLARMPGFAPPCDENPLDNEHPDTNSDGVQLHWRSVRDGGWNSVLAVPVVGSPTVRLSVIEGHADGVEASYRSARDGYAVTFTLPWAGPDTPLEFDLIVNERPLGRERRRGQLVLSGANGESAYLRGARQDASRALTILFQHPSS